MSEQIGSVANTRRWARAAPVHDSAARAAGWQACESGLPAQASGPRAHACACSRHAPRARSGGRSCTPHSGPCPCPRLLLLARHEALAERAPGLELVVRRAAQTHVGHGGEPAARERLHVVELEPGSAAAALAVWTHERALATVAFIHSPAELGRA